MRKIDNSIRRPAGLAAALAALLALGACESLEEAFKGVNPIARELDRSAGRSPGGGAESLAIPPDYSLRPSAGKAGTGGERRTGAGAAEGGDKAPDKAADAKKIDLGTGTTDGAAGGGRIVPDVQPGTRAPAAGGNRQPGGKLQIPPAKDES